MVLFIQIIFILAIVSGASLLGSYFDAVKPNVNNDFLVRLFSGLVLVFCGLVVLATKMGWVI